MARLLVNAVIDSEVSLISEYISVGFRGDERVQLLEVSLIWRCPQFSDVMIEEFHSREIVIHCVCVCVCVCVFLHYIPGLVGGGLALTGSGN